MIAALDIGSTYSGYAFMNSMGIACHSKWENKSHSFEYSKVPTCILFNNSKRFTCFGYDAEEYYEELASSDEEHHCYFVKQFKSVLYSKNITRDIMLKDVGGRDIPAAYVFEQFIKALANHLVESQQECVTKKDIQWIIPTSQDLTDNALHFLRFCAEQAGILPDQLMFMPEEEAAFTYCHRLPDQDHYHELKDGTEYMLVQLGGFGTSITVLKKDANRVIENHRTTGTDCGGISVNASLKELLVNIMGSQVMTALRQDDPFEHCWLESEIETIKRKFQGNQNEKKRIYIPINELDCLCKKYHDKNLQALIKGSLYHDTIRLAAGQLRFDPDVLHNLFKPTIDKIIYMMESMLADYKDPDKVSDIIMVGGFSRCVIVQDALRKKFWNKNIIIPNAPELAVVEGAVLCGNHPCLYMQIPSCEKSESILTNLSHLNRIDFKDLVALGTFASFENRVYLAGPCNTGKSSLASVLIGETIPKKWISTDGLIIHFGRNGIDLQRKKMVPLKKGSDDVLTKLLLGNPDLQYQQHKLSRKDYRDQLDDDNKDDLKDVSQSAIVKQENESINSLADHQISTAPKPTEETSVSRQIPAVSNKNNPPVSGFKAVIGKLLQKRSPYTAHSIQDKLLNKIKNRSFKIDIAPSDLVDFGGQKSFDMTHQLFIQHKGTFILMFDGRKGLHTELDEYTQGDVTAASILEHWINSVLTYCDKSDDKMPRVVFAASHSDSFSEDEKEKLALLFKKELTKMFSTHKFQEHIKCDEVFFINATDVNDLHIDRLKDTLVEIAFQQSTWGQRMPIVWVPLDLQISDMRADGVKLITRARLFEMNNSNNEFTLSERRLEDFLLVQHSIGKLLYFNEPTLRDFIVIQPTAMVNILRAFITDKMFWPKNGPVRNILETLSSAGVLKKSELFTLWSQQAFKDILTDIRSKEYMVHVLLHLDILVEPKRYTGMNTAMDSFLVPCIVKEKIPPQIQQSATSDRTICIAYRLKETAVPSALLFKLIGAAISIWPLKIIDSRYCLFFQAAVMDADETNELHILVEGHRIVLYLVNKVSKQLISPDLATTTQECLTLALGRILQFYNRCFGRQENQPYADLLEIEVGEICRGETCFIPLTDAQSREHWRCKNGEIHETKCSLSWFFDKNKEQCDPNCEGLKTETLLLKPNDQHFVQLARKIGIGDFYSFFIHLGMTKTDYDDLNFRYFSNPMDFMLMGLFNWRDTEECNRSTTTFDKLLKALTAIESEHYLCQVHREDHSLVDKAERRLQDIPSDVVINGLTKENLIGDCVVHFGVELGLSIGNIKETMHNFPRNLNGQIHNLLVKWKTQKQHEKVKPTIYRLMVALKRVRAAEGLAFVKRSYGVE